MDELRALDLGPENEEQLARLRRALILGAGFQIIFLEVSHPSLTKEVLRRLRAWSGHDGIPPLEIVRTRPGRDPVAPLRHIMAGAVLVGIDRSLDTAGLERELVTIDDSGPEERLDAPAEKLIEQTMTTLNWYRDQLPALVKGPLVLVLSPDGLRQLFVHAPDLLAWRAHTTRVTLPRPIDLEVRPRPSRRASLEEKAWLEKIIASSDSNGRGSLALELPGWLIRLGAIDSREGGSGEASFARAAELAAGRRLILFRLDLARARHALDEERYEDAAIHISRAAAQVSTGSSETKQALELVLATMGRGAAARDLWTRPAANDLAILVLAILVAEHALRTGEVELADTVAELVLQGARAYGDLALVIAALGVAGAVASHRGDAATASARFDEVRRLARDAQDRAAELFALTHLAELAPDGRSAGRLYLEALSLLEDDDHEARARVCIGLLRQQLDEEAGRVLLQIAVVELTPKTRIRFHVARGDMAMRQGHDEAALVAYRSAWVEPQRALLPSLEQAHIGMSLGEAALRAGDTETARGAFVRVAELAKVLANGWLAALARFGLERAGVAAEDTGKPA